MPDRDISRLAGLIPPGRYGRSAGAAGVIVEERDLALASIVARKDQADAVRGAAELIWGVALPNRPGRVEAGDIAFAWTGADQWLAMTSEGDGAALDAELGSKLADLASVTDQSDGRIVLRVSGHNVRDALAKGVPIDLHPRVFRPGDAATTIVAHVPAHFWQTDDAPTYEFAVPRSFADSFWHWLSASAAEYGCEVVESSPGGAGDMHRG